MGSILPGSLSPFAKLPPVELAQFRIPLHHTTGLNSRGFGTGSYTKAAPGWYYDPTTQLFKNASANEARIETKGLLVEPATTNSCLENRTFTTSPWTNSGCVLTQDEDGIDGVANTAWTVEDDSSVVQEYFYQGVTLTANTEYQCFSIFIKKTVGAVTFPAIYFNMTGGSSKTAAININTNTGGVVPHSTTMPDYYGSDSYGDWWRVWFSKQNDNNTSSNVYIYPAASTDVATWSASVTGSAIFDMPQFEKDQSFPTSPLVTTTTAVSRLTDNLLYTWPIPAAVSTILADAGTLICMWTPGFVTTMQTANQGIVSCEIGGSLDSLFFIHTDNKLYSHDGVNYATTAALSLLKGQTYILAVNWDIGGTQFEVGISDGVTWAWGTAATWDGSYEDGGTLYTGSNVNYPFHIKNIYFHDLLTQAQVEAIY